MKTMALLPAVAAAILALSISAASSQQACMKAFQGCMDGCTNKQSKTVQDTCFQGCEGKNNVCAERVYGKRPLNSAPAANAEAKDTSKDAPAEAKTEKQAADARDQADPKQVQQKIEQQKPAPSKR
jgi:hypothetical protein